MCIAWPGAQCIRSLSLPPSLLSLSVYALWSWTPFNGICSAPPASRGLDACAQLDCRYLSILPPLLTGLTFQARRSTCQHSRGIRVSVFALVSSSPSMPISLALGDNISARPSRHGFHDPPRGPEGHTGCLHRLLRARHRLLRAPRHLTAHGRSSAGMERLDHAHRGGT